jgi:hypothetical protein
VAVVKQGSEQRRRRLSIGEEYTSVSGRARLGRSLTGLWRPHSCAVVPSTHARTHARTHDTNQNARRHAGTTCTQKSFTTP